MNFASQGIKGHSMGVKFHRDWIRNKTRELDQFIGFAKNLRKLVYSVTLSNLSKAAMISVRRAFASCRFSELRSYKMEG